MKIIWRNYNRTEQDDYKLNVQPSLSKHVWSLELRSCKGVIVGWKLIPAYE